MRAGPSAPTPVSIVTAHWPPAPVWAPIACPLPIAVPNLPAVAHGRPVLRETKNANFLASTHYPLPQIFARKTIPENLETMSPPAP